MNILENMHETEVPGIYTLVMEDQDPLDAHTLKQLNVGGYVYETSIEDVSYEDIEDGEYVTKYMDIHYFYKMDALTVGKIKDTLNDFFCDAWGPPAHPFIPRKQKLHI